VAENTPVPLNRIERVLAFMVAGIGGLSLLAIVAILIATVSNVDTSEGPWLPIAVFPQLGLPVTFVLIVVFAVISIVRRRRLSEGGK
jgi:TRAP-type C4-dicarboxylate transport system permease small subunit